MNWFLNSLFILAQLFVSWWRLYRLIYISYLQLLTVIATVYLPQLPQKHGSLYEGLRILISNEKLNADAIWNETQLQIDENEAVLHTALDYMHNYETILNEKLSTLNSFVRTEKFQTCYKPYERQIARFNRDLITKYLVCKHALNSSLSQLKHEIVSEVKYIHDAAIEIQELVYDCDVADLKRVSNKLEQAATTLCVLTKLGEINQHMLEAAQVCLDIIARMRVSDEHRENDEFDPDFGLNTNSICLDFQYIREEFNTIYENVMQCVNEMN